MREEKEETCREVRENQGGPRSVVFNRSQTFVNVRFVVVEVIKFAIALTERTGCCFLPYVSTQPTFQLHLSNSLDWKLPNYFTEMSCSNFFVTQPCERNGY